jgi:hypothetical protein
MPVELRTVTMARFAKGDRVTQARYGAGTIVEVDDDHTVIDFDEHGVRKFVNRIVTLTRSTEPAPPRPTTRRRAPSKKAAEAKAKRGDS